MVQKIQKVDLKTLAEDIRKILYTILSKLERDEESVAILPSFLSRELQRMGYINVMYLDIVIEDALSSVFADEQLLRCIHFKIEKSRYVLCLKNRQKESTQEHMHIG